MGRRSRWFLEKGRNTRKNKIRSYEQQQLDGRSKEIQRMERQRRKLLKDMVAFSGPRSLYCSLSVLSQTCPHYASCLAWDTCCAATYVIIVGPGVTSLDTKYILSSHRFCRACRRPPDSESIDNTDGPPRPPRSPRTTTRSGPRNSSRRSARPTSSRFGTYWDHRLPHKEPSLKNLKRRSQRSSSQWPQPPRPERWSW